jgi:hypothetical protein
MMFDKLSDYLDAARMRQGLRSDRALARLMQVPQPYVTDWRTGKEPPSDTNMRVLAQLAGGDEEQALVLLNIWRAKDEPTRDTYRRLLRRVGGGTGLAVAVAASLALGGPSEQGRGWSFSQLAVALIHYYGKFRRFPRRVAAALAQLRAFLAPDLRPTAPIAS